LELASRLLQSSYRHQRARIQPDKSVGFGAIGNPVPPNKAIVGANAFSHSSGIHVDGFLKDRQTYEIMRPEDGGLRESRVVLTARTGRAGLRDRLERLGFTLSPEELNRAYTRFLYIADEKQEVFDEDLMEMVHEELQPAADHCQLEYLHVSGGTSSVPTASVKLKIQGESREATSTGEGPIDAVYKALSAITHSSVKLLKYEIRSVTSRTEAMGEATVHLQQGEVKIVGRGASTDIIEASAKACVDGANKLARVVSRHWVDTPVQAVCRVATFSRLRLAISNSRILNFCTLPLRVIG